jgi:hypothetical protein
MLRFLNNKYIVIKLNKNIFKSNFNGCNTMIYKKYIFMKYFNYMGMKM